MVLPFYYNWRNLRRRRLSVTLTFFLVSVVVFVLAALLSFAAGIRASLAATGSSRNVIILKPGSTAESTSIMLPSEASRIVQAPNIAHGSTGQLLISPELCVQTNIPRRGPVGTPASVAIRGVDDIAYEIHAELKILEGRRPRQGMMEIIVGKAARERYANLEPGGRLEMGRLANRVFTVVGVFEAGGGAIESEVWAPRTMLEDAFNRRFLSSVVVRLADPAAARATIDYVNGPAVELDAQLETRYYDELSTKTREIVFLTTVLIGIMAIGAIFAVANTMYAAVDGRKREIAMLRTIGFARGSIMLSFVIESLLISSTACAAGLGASLFINGSRQDFLSDTTWTVLAYELRITPGILLSAFGLATLVGVGGALAPALKASRMRVIEALRKA